VRMRAMAARLSGQSREGASELGAGPNTRWGRHATQVPDCDAPGAAHPSLGKEPWHP